MNFFRRAIRYCRRQKLRSIILLLVFTLLSSAALTALSVRRAAAGGTEKVKKAVGASIHIGLDESRENFGSGIQNENGITYQYNGDYITQAVIDAVSRVEGVVGYSAETEDGYWGAGVNFDYFPGAFNIDYSGGHGQPVPYTITFNSQLSEKFLNGTYTLEEGRHIAPEDSFAALISRELAEKNGLSVGDSITMYDLDTDSENTFEIVGIFSGTEGMSKDAMMSDGIAANRGYIDGNSYQKMWHETTLELGSLDVYVDSAENVRDVLEIIKNLPELRDRTFTYSTDTENFDLISDPLSSLQSMVDAAVIGIAAAGAALVSFLLLLWTKGRKKEAGILMAVGKSRMEIVLQFLTENILLAIPAAAAAWGMACLSAERAGEFLVTQTADGVDSLDVTVLPADAAAVFGVGILLLILAVLLASCAIIRLQPRMILSQME